MKLPTALITLAAIAALQPHAARAEVPETLLTSPLAELFGAPPTFGSPKLSPKGDQMIFLQQDEAGVRILGLVDFSTGEIMNIWSGEVDDHQVEWCEWANEDRLLCEFLEVTQRDNNPVAFIKYFSLDTQGTEFQRIELCGRNIDWLPEDPETIMSVCGARIFFVNLYSRYAMRAGLNRTNSDLMVTDGHGSARLARQRMLTDRWYARNDPDDRWRRIYRSRGQRFEDPFQPVGFGEDLDEVLHIAWNSERWGLYAKNLSGDLDDRLVFVDSNVDVEHVDRIGAYNRAVAVTYLDGGPRQFVFDERVAAIQQLAGASLPGTTIEVIDESWDQRFYLIRANTPNHAGQLFRIDAVEESVDLIGPEYSHLADTPLAMTRTVVFPGSDGGQISGHLTLPVNGVFPAPVVMMPRAAPDRSDVMSPHYLVQFLSANGYAVFRVNQRGPAEYGGNWAPNKVIVGSAQTASDLTAASEFLIEEGIAAPGRICGAGRDIGAYAALMTALENPDLFACIFSIGGNTDPREFFFGMPSLVYTMLEESSPVQRAAEFQPPILLFSDRAARQSESLEDALARANRDVTSVEYVNARPQFDEKPIRVDMLTRIDAFLAEQLK
jgi:dipeptidyl aminopeptidase/acylaminoacyl peptidase